MAVRTLREAARSLGSSDPGAAADLTRRALDLAGPRDPLHGPLAAETALLLHSERSAPARAGGRGLAQHHLDDCGLG